MKKQLTKIIAQEHLTQEEAKACLFELTTQTIPEEQIAAFMTALQCKGVQLDELAGFQEALLELSAPLNLGTTKYIDVCGTGGDGKDTFNISTSSAFILASMGYPVVKHGNYGVSSLCGSSNVLEYLGVKFTSDSAQLKYQLEKQGLVFLHAPLFHPVLKSIAPIRKNMGIPSFFNELGPLLNPAQPDFQITGTYRLGLARYYQHLLHKTRKSYYVIHGLNGYDELTFDGSTRILGRNEDFVLTHAPNSIPINRNEMAGGTIAQSAEILRSIIAGQGNTTQNTIVAGNVALGIRCFEPETSFEFAFNKALEHIHSGQAFHLLKTFQS